MTTTEQLTFLPAAPPTTEGKRAKAKGKKEVSAPLVQDGQSLVIGSLATGARYEPRCLVCGCFLVIDETHYGVPMCAGCVRVRGGHL